MRYPGKFGVQKKKRIQSLNAACSHGGPFDTPHFGQSNYTSHTFTENVNPKPPEEARIPLPPFDGLYKKITQLLQNGKKKRSKEEERGDDDEPYAENALATVLAACEWLPTSSGKHRIGNYFVRKLFPRVLNIECVSMKVKSRNLKQFLDC